MNQSRAFLVSLVFALFGAGLVYFFIIEKEKEYKSKYGDEVQVVIAADDINELEVFDEEMLTIKSIPKTFVQPGAFQVATGENESDAKMDAFSQIVKRKYMGAIKKGEQILATKLLRPGVETGLAHQVGIAKRALSIPVSNVTGANKLLKPGDHVDVIAAIHYASKEGNKTETVTVLQNVRLLAVGELIHNEQPYIEKIDPVTNDRISQNLSRNNNFETVTVEVSPEDSQAIVHILADSSSSSELYLSLRNPVDRVVATVGTTTENELMPANSLYQKLKKPAPIVRKAPVVRKPAAAKKVKKKWKPGLPLK